MHDPGFTQRVILIDPALELAEEDFPSVFESVVGEARNPATEEPIRADNPGWEPECVRAKALAGRQASPTRSSGR